MACDICKKTYIPPTNDNSFTFNERPHLCKVCGKTFALKIELKQHLISHEGNVPYVCNSCQSESSYNLRLSKKGDFACETCNKTFVTKRALLRHAGEHTRENVLCCDECGLSFKNMTALKRHVATHKPIKNYLKKIRRNSSGQSSHQCQECGKYFARLKQYEIHCLNHKKYHCRDCNIYFASNNLLQEHLNSSSCQLKSETLQDSSNSNNVSSGNNVSNKHECHICGKSFALKSTLQGHMVSHKSLQETACKDSSLLRSEISLDSSNSNVVSNLSKKYECNICDKRFARKSALENHMVSHNLSKESLSSDSGRLKSENFPDASNSNIVSNCNSDTKKHECNICNKTFARKSALEGHMFSHFTDNNESPVEEESDKDDMDDKDMDFQCSLKDDKSDESCLPKIKIRPPYPCEKCTLEFSTKMSLNKHMLSHIKISEYKKTYKCRMCQETFVLKENYKQHKLTHDPSELNREEKKNYTCKICLKVFAKRKHLKKHFKTHLDEASTDDSNFSKTLVEENSTDKSVSQDESLLFSMKREKRAKNFACQHCGKLFAGETCWKKHEAKHNKNDDDDKDKEDAGGRVRKGKKPKPLICPFCNEDYTGKRHAFVKHKLSHTPEVCGICDARFTDRASLREHCRIHIGTEEGRRFLECSQKVLDAKNGVVHPEPKVEYIYLVLR